MLDRRDLAVHDAPRPYDSPAVRLADRLVAEADAEYGDLRTEALHARDADARFRRRARARRNHDPVGLHLRDLVQRNLVVAAHDRLCAEIADELDEVPREGVVIV